VGFRNPSWEFIIPLEGFRCPSTGGVQMSFLGLEFHWRDSDILLRGSKFHWRDSCTFCTIKHLLLALVFKK